MSLYCSYCYPGGVGSSDLSIPEGESSCRRCGNTNFLRCASCERPVAGGLSYCPRCQPVELVASRERPWLSAMEPSLPSLGPLSLVVPTMPQVPERYSVGRYGIKAEVTIPAGDVAIMNELGALVSALHIMAGQLNHFTGLTDHTRKLIRDMRVLAADAQEEVEMRRGPI